MDSFENHQTVKHLLFHLPGPKHKQVDLGYSLKRERKKKHMRTAASLHHVGLGERVKSIGKTPHVPWSMSL